MSHFSSKGSWEKLPEPLNANRIMDGRPINIDTRGIELQGWPFTVMHAFCLGLITRSPVWGSQVMNTFKGKFMKSNKLKFPWRSISGWCSLQLHGCRNADLFIGNVGKWDSPLEGENVTWVKNLENMETSHACWGIASWLQQLKCFRVWKDHLSTVGS